MVVPGQAEAPNPMLPLLLLEGERLLENFQMLRVLHSGRVKWLRLGLPKTDVAAVLAAPLPFFREAL